MNNNDENIKIICEFVKDEKILYNAVNGSE